MTHDIDRLERLAPTDSCARRMLIEAFDRQGDQRSKLLRLTAFPHDQNWNAILLECEKWDPIYLGEVVEWLSPYLSQWPDHLRGVGVSWLNKHFANMQNPIARLVRTLSMDGYWSGGVIPLERVAALLDANDLANIRKLSFASRHLCDEHINQIIKIPYIERITDLNLSDNREISAEGIRSLVSANSLGNLKRLQLSSICPTIDDGLLSPSNTRKIIEFCKAFCHDSSLNSLTHLDLSDNFLGGMGLPTLLNSPLINSLTHLDLSSNSLGREGVDIIAQSSSLRFLTELSLAGNGLDDVAVGRLAASKSHGRLKEINLSYNKITSEGIELMAQSPWLENLQRLYLSNGGPDERLGPRGAAILANAPWFQNLTELVLCNQSLGDAGVAALAMAPRNAKFEQLDFGDNIERSDRPHIRNPMSDAAAVIFAKAFPCLEQLRSLRLGKHQIGDIGARALADSYALERLVELDLHDNSISEAGATALRESRCLRSIIELHVYRVHAE